MRPKSYPIQIWHLDEDPTLSAQYLNNELLFKTARGCIQAIVAARFYFIGIRSKKFYSYYFNKEHKQDTIDKFFPLWPFAKPPLFTSYDSRQSKWCRKCKEHYDYIVSYLRALALEYEYRHRNSLVTVQSFLDWLENDAPQLNISKANLKHISFEWKCLNPKYRSKDIVEGYRKQYKAKLTNDGIKIDDFTNRDIPEFLLEDELKKASEKWML